VYKVLGSIPTPQEKKKSGMVCLFSFCSYHGPAKSTAPRPGSQPSTSFGWEDEALRSELFFK
jgi:hypothetical protein